MVDYCQIRADRIRDSGYAWMTQRRRSMILSALARLRELAARDQEALTWSHGDYAPNNMIWDGRTLTPIDFAMANLDYPLKDVSYFIHRLEMLAIYAPHRRWPVDAWTRLFLAGYERPDAASAPTYRALSIRYWLCRLNTYVSRATRNEVQRWHARWVRQRVRTRLLAAVHAELT